MSKKLLGNKKRGLVFVISAPAGTGKSTLAQMLLDEFPETVVESCSCTTRTPRMGEVAQKHYIFITPDQFEEKMRAGEFLEYAKVYGNYYGTLRTEVLGLQEQGKHVILVIDTQGAMQLKGKFPATFIFISPPSMDELKRRLHTRKTESEEKIQERLDWAVHEMKMISHYDYHIINDNLEISYQILRGILMAEEHKLKNLEGINTP